MFHLFKKSKTIYLIHWKSEFGWQVIDTADTIEEAKELLPKYKKAYKGNLKITSTHQT